jgi:hypothetical protein
MTDLLAACFPRTADVAPRWQEPVRATAPSGVVATTYDVWRGLGHGGVLTMAKIEAWWTRYKAMCRDRAL